MKKSVLIILFLMFFVRFVVALPQTGHDASEFDVNVGSEIVDLDTFILNYIDGGYGSGSYSPISGSNNPGHSMEDIIIATADGDRTLYEALNSGMKIFGHFGLKVSEGSVGDLQHSSEDIILSTGETLQDVINKGDLCIPKTCSDFGYECAPDGVDNGCGGSLLGCVGCSDGISCNGGICGDCVEGAVQSADVCGDTEYRNYENVSRTCRADRTWGDYGACSVYYEYDVGEFDLDDQCNLVLTNPTCCLIYKDLTCLRNDGTAVAYNPYCSGLSPNEADYQGCIEYVWLDGGSLDCRHSIIRKCSDNLGTHCGDFTAEGRTLECRNPDSCGNRNNKADIRNMICSRTVVPFDRRVYR